DRAARDAAVVPPHHRVRGAAPRLQRRGLPRGLDSQAGALDRPQRGSGGPLSKGGRHSEGGRRKAEGGIGTGGTRTGEGRDRGADNVLARYGPGAIVGVPAHDARDHAFAVEHGLAFVPVIAPPGETAANCGGGSGSRKGGRSRAALRQGSRTDLSYVGGVPLL